jgi:hypothetical protein
VDYSPFIVESKEEAWVKEEKRPGVILIAVPLQSSQVQPQFHGFEFLCRLPMRMPQGGLYIVIFTSSSSI